MKWTWRSDIIPSFTYLEVAWADMILAIYLFSPVHVYVSLVYVGIPIRTCVWSSDVGSQYLLWRLFCLVLWDDRLPHFERDFLTQSGAQHFGKASWLMSSGDMPVSKSLLFSSREGNRPATFTWGWAAPLRSLCVHNWLFTDWAPCPWACLLRFFLQSQLTN